MTKQSSLTFSKARSLFPHTKKVTYFGAASIAPISIWVRDAIAEYFEERTDRAKDDTKLFFSSIDSLRAEYATLVGARKDEMGVGLSASFAMNIAAFGLPLKPGDEVLLSDVEFPAAVYTWRGAAEARGLTLRFVPSVNREFSIEHFEKAITGKTRVLCLSWVQYFNGFKSDLAAISDICRKHDIWFVVDGTMGMGAEHINVKMAGVDIFAVSCQKWMLSPQGCGFFYIRRDIQDILTPSLMSWHSVEWHQEYTDLFRYNLPYADSARRFECGYYVVSNVIGMRAANRFFLGLGTRNIEKHNHGLIDRLVRYLRQNDIYHITSSMVPRHRSSVLAFTCADVMTLHRELLKRRIIQVVREGSIRISPHLYNNDIDTDCLIDVLKDFAAHKRPRAQSTSTRSAQRRSVALRKK